MDVLKSINDLFGIENEVSAPILITLLVFITGGLITFIYNRIKSYQKRKDIRDIFRVMVIEIIKDCEIREQNTKIFYEKFTTEHIGNWSLSISRINYLNTLFELDFNEVFQSFESNINSSFCGKKIKKIAFHKIYANLDNLRYLEGFIKSDMQDFISDFNRHHNKYKESISKFSDMVDVLRFDFQHSLPLIQGRSVEEDYMIETEQIWQKWLAIDNNKRVHFKSTYDNLIEPTLTLNRKPHGLSFTLEMNKHLMECKTQYIEMDSILERGYLTFKNHNFNYRASRRILTKCMDVLS